MANGRTDVQPDEDLLAFPFPDTFSPQPSGTLAEIAQRAPAIRVQFGPAPIWLIVRHAPARAMLGDPRFSRARTLQMGPPLTGGGVPDPNSLLFLDPPRHTRIRKLVSAAFAHRRTEELRPWIRDVARTQVAAMMSTGGPADLRDDLAFHLPIEVICQLLGVPEVNRAQVRAWGEALFRFFVDREAATDALQKLHAYMDSLVSARQTRLEGGQAPQTLFDALVSSRDEGDRLSQAELRSLALTLLIGGFETTAAVISNAVVTLLAERSHWEWLIADPGRMETAVEELLRYQPLSMTFPRVATEDVTLGDFTIRAGEVAVAPFAAVNRDTELYQEPDRLDLSRHPVPNLTFGHGIHHCLGAHLARVELTEVLTALVEMVPDLRLAVPPEELRYELRPPIGRPETLPVTW